MNQVKHKNIPKIVVRKPSTKSETDIFMRFLNNPLFPNHKYLIFKIFPMLQQNIVKESFERKSIAVFIKAFYKKHKEEIENVIHRDQKDIAKRGKRAVKVLGKIMEYTWRKGCVYEAVPTILPFSPLQRKKFYFSILGDLIHKQSHDAVMIAIHEISHFIFFDLLKGIEKKSDTKISIDVMYYAKEAITIALFNTNPLKKILWIRRYDGNPELSLFRVEYEGKIISLVRYVEKELRRKTSFKEKVERIITTFNAHNNEFKMKRKIWNRCGKKLPIEKQILDQYKIPILLAPPKKRR